MIFLSHILCFLLLSPTGVDHDFHLSKTDIHYKSDKKALQFTVHMFIDDLELAILQKSEIETRLFTEKEFTNADSLIAAYLQDYLLIKLDSKVVETGYLGREISDDLSGIWVYLEIGSLSSVHTLEVNNRLLLDTYDDQKNITNIKHNNKLVSYDILDKGGSTKVVEF